MTLPAPRRVAGPQAPTPEEMGAIQSAAHLSGVIPYVENEFSQLKVITIRRALTAIRDGKLSGELAVALWMEIWALEAAGMRLRTKVAVGQDAGARHQQALNQLNPSE